MSNGYFEEGKFIYECKSSPDRMGDSINQGSLKKWIGDLKRILRDRQPEGFRYIFPVNRLNSENISLLNQLKNDFGGIDIQYFDCDSVDRLIFALEKVNSLPELVTYIKQERSK